MEMAINDNGDECVGYMYRAVCVCAIFCIPFFRSVLISGLLSPILSCSAHIGSQSQRVKATGHGSGFLALRAFAKNKSTSEVHVTRRDIQNSNLEASDPDCANGWLKNAAFVLLCVCVAKE